MASPPWSADECRMLVKYWGRWCNYHVAKRGKKLPDLLPGVAGGSGLAWLLAGLAPDVADKLPPLPHDKPRSRSHKVSNHVVLQRFMRHTLAIPLPDDCSAERLGDGDAVAVLALLWALALHFQFRALLPAPTSPRGHGAGASDRQGAAVAAVRRALQDKLARFLARDETSAAREGGRTSVALSSAPAMAAAAAISNFQQDFSDGALFSAIIHRQCPEVLEVEGLDAKDKRGNLKRALRLLRRKWGVPKLVDVESLQLQAGVRPEEVEKCVMVYLALVFARFDDQPSPLLRRKSKGSFLFGSKSLPITATTATATSSSAPHPVTASSSSTPSASAEHNSVVQTQPRSCSFPAVASVLPAAPRPPVSASSPSLLSGGTLDNLGDDDDGLSSGISTSSKAPSPHQPRGDDVEDQLRQKQAAGYKGPRHSELFIDQATRLQLQATLDSFSRAPQPPEQTTSTSTSGSSTSTSTSGSSSSSKGAEGGRRAGHSPHKKRAEPALQSRGSVIKSVHKKPEKESLQLLLECAMLGQDLDLSNQTFENFDSLIRFLAAKEASGGKPGNSSSSSSSSSKSKSPSSRDGARPRAMSDLDGEGSDVVSHTEVTDLSDLHSESDDDDVFDDDDLSELASLALDCAWDSPRYKKYLDPDFEPGDDTTDDGDLESTDTDFDATLTSLSEPSTPRSNHDKKDSGLMDLVADLRSLGLAVPPEAAAGDGEGVPATIVPAHHPMEDLSALLLPRDVAQPDPRAPSPRDASVGPFPAGAIAGPLAELHHQQQRDVPLLHQSLPAPIATRPPPAPTTSPEPVVGRLSQSQSLVGIGGGGGGGIGQSPGGAPLFSDVRRLWQERATVTASSRKGRTWDNLQRAMEEEMIKKAKADGRRRQQLDTQPAPAAATAATAAAAAAAAAARGPAQPLQLASAAAQTSPIPADAAAASGSSLHRPESAPATAALPPESASSDAMGTVRQELGRLEELMGAWERAKEAPYLHGVVLTTKSLVSRVKPLALAMGKQTGDEAALRSQELVGRMLELATLFRQNTTASDAVLQAKSREFVLAAAHLAHVVLPAAAVAPLVAGDDEHAVPTKDPAPQRSTRAPDDVVPLGSSSSSSSGKTEGRSPPIPSLRLAVLAPATAAASPPQANQGEAGHHPNVTSAAAVDAVLHQRDTLANDQQRHQATAAANGGGGDEDRFRAWRRDIGCCTFLDASSLRNFAELLRTVISHAQEVADRPEALQRRAQIVQDCQHLATAGAEWIRCGAACTTASARTGGTTTSSLQTPPKTPRTESRIKNRLLAAFDRLDKSVHATTSTSSGGSGPVTPTGRLSPMTRTGELSPRLAPRALSWSADELAGVSGGGEEVGLEEHVNLVVRGLTRAVGLCSDETGGDAPSGFHAADVRQLLRTITRALQVTAAKLPLEYRKAVLDAAEKYLQCAIPLVSAIEQCHAETEAAKRKELSQATHIARIRWMTAFRVLVTTLKDAVSAQQPSAG